MEMICDSCGRQGARLRRLTRSIGRGRTALLIDGVPVVQCPHCGESYLTAKTLREIERIRSRRRGIVKTRVLPVARFGGAA